MTESSGIAEDETSGSSTRATEGAVVTNLTGDGSLQKTVADMAAILKDVVSELKILKGSGISDARSAEGNYNHNKTPAIHIDTPSPEYAVSDVCANVPQRVQQMQPMYHRDGRYTDETGYAEYQQVPNREHAWERHRSARNFHHHNERLYENETRATAARHNKQTTVKITPYNGTEEWTTWITQFETIAYRCGWSEDEKLDQLLPSLKGVAAQFVFSQLSSHTINCYADLIAELNSRFRVIETPRSFAAKFSRRAQRHGETVEEFAADLKMLYDRAHRCRDRQTREEDLVRRFLDGLYDEEIKFEVEFNKETRTVDEAVYHVVNLMQIRNGSRNDRKGRFNTRRAYETKTDEKRYSGNNNRRRFTDNNSVPNTDPRKIPVIATSDNENNRQSSPIQNELIQGLLARIDKLEKERVRKNAVNKSEVECYSCHGIGHYARECPKRTNENRERDSSSTQFNLNYQGPTLATKGRSQ
jgi:hypothetical protein